MRDFGSSKNRDALIAQFLGKSRSLEDRLCRLSKSLELAREINSPECWRQQDVGRKTAHCIFKTDIILRDRASKIRQLLVQAQSVDATQIIGGFHAVILERRLRVMDCDRRGVYRKVGLGGL